VRVLVLLCERGQHCIAEAALEEMVFDGDDPAGRLRGGLQRVRVDRLDRVGVDHACADSFFVERCSGFECLVNGDSDADDRDVVVVGRPDHLAAADFELVVRAVDDRRVRAQRAKEDDAFRVRHLGDELRGLVCVARMEHDAGVNRPE
jgi:hypothetical protein